MLTPKYSQLSEIQTALREQSISMQALVEYYLEQIEASKALNIYVEVYAEEALTKAKAIDEALQNNSDALGRLYGMVLSHKDVICYAVALITNNILM